MKKSRLSAWNYIKNNGRVVFVLVISLMLSFLAMYVIHVLLQTTVESFKPSMLNAPKKISFATLSVQSYGIDPEEYSSNAELNEAFLSAQSDLTQKLKAREGIEEAVYTQVLMSRYQSVIGENSFRVPLVDPEQIPVFLKHMDAELVEGRLPENDGEILVDSVLMKNQRFQVGDWFQKDFYGESFRIVGKIRSEYLFCVGTPKGNYNNGWYFVVCNDEKTTDLSGILKEEGITLNPEDEVLDLAFWKKTFSEEVEGVISKVISGISLAVTIFLALLVLISYISFMRNRIREYCLYESIGYGRGEIYGMILREMFLLFAIGSLAGLILSVITGIVIDEVLIFPRGLVGKLIYGDRILRILGIFVFLMGILQIPVLSLIGRIRTIDAIEEYD